MTTTTKSATIGPFVPGMNNRLPDFALYDRELGMFVRSVVNADVLAKGNIKRRKGSALEVSGSDCHSAWSDSTARFGYYVDSSVLYRFDDAGATLRTTVVRSDMHASARVSFAEVAGEVYYSNGQTIGRIDAAGAAHPAGVPQLSRTPVVTAGAENSGSMSAGRYQIVFVQVNEDGEESGSTFPVQVEVPERGSIVVTDLPTSFPVGASALRYYITPPDGDMLYAGGYLGVGASFTLTTPPPAGGRCQTLLMTQMPPGDIVRYLNGRLMVASRHVLHYSEPFAPALYNPAKNYIEFTAPITVVEPCQNGTYVVADQAYWLAGDLASTSLAPVLPYGAAMHSGVQIPTENAVAWMSTRGLCRGDQNGNAKNLQDAHVAIEPGSAAASLFREVDGNKHLVSTLFGVGPTQMAADSFVTAEVIRKGTTP